MDDNKISQMISSDESENLHKYIDVIEERVRKQHLQSQKEIEKISNDISKIREAVEGGNRINILSEICKTGRSISEGIIGSALYDLIPDNLKSYLKNQLLGKSEDPRTNEVEKLYIIQIPILIKSVLAFNFSVRSKFPFSFTFSGLDMLICCGSDLAAMLRIAFQDSRISYPSENDWVGKPRRVSSGEAKRIEEWLKKLQENLAFSILKVGGENPTPETVIENAVNELCEQKFLGRRSLFSRLTSNN